MNKSKIIVLSGVNLTEGGPLRVFEDAIKAFSKTSYEIICLVNNKKNFNLDLPCNVTFVEFKYPKKNWINRVFFEYINVYFLAKKIKPDIWLSLHDISPNLPKGIKQFVYCHNPSPFYKATKVDWKFSKKFSLFTLFYSYLYRINIQNNDVVICQQSWIADEFKLRFGIKNVLVSKPIQRVDNTNSIITRSFNSGEINLFYPTLPRTFKNIELLIDAVAHSEKIQKNVKIYVTIDEYQGKYAKYLIESSKNFDCFVFTGYLERCRINELYNKCDIVIFPSKLETWGLPISEAVSYNKAIILSDLPYAHETLGEYEKSCFIDPYKSDDLILVLESLIDGQNVFSPAKFVEHDDIATNWDMLVDKLLVDY